MAALVATRVAVEDPFASVLFVSNGLMPFRLQLKSRREHSHLKKPCQSTIFDTNDPPKEANRPKNFCPNRSKIGLKFLSLNAGPEVVHF
jgi:hypothetical protein